MASVVRVDFREFQLGDWLIRPASNTISRDRLIRHLQPQSMNVLVYLAEHAGEVVSSEQILAALWPGIYTGDDAVHRRIADLRKQLGDDARNPRYIRTVQKRGYGLIAPVSRERSAAPERLFAATVSERPHVSLRRRLPVALFVCALIVILTVLTLQQRSRVQLEVALAEAEQLLIQDLYQQAYRQIEPWLHRSGEPRVARLIAELTVPVTVMTSPPGVRVMFRPAGTDADWSLLGSTPIRNLRLPRGSYRLSLDERLMLYATNPGVTFNNVGGGLRTLEMPQGTIPDDMVFIPAGRYRFGAWGFMEPADLGGFLLDRTEVTNAAYQEFVDAGGYSDKALWQPLIDASDGLLSWEIIEQRFVDTTGQPGPGGWALGSYSAGEGALPVTSVSWFEAAAYLSYRNKILPSARHWLRAALGPMESSFPFAPGVVPASNLAGGGLWPVASQIANEVNGAYDLIGNAREWTTGSNGAKRIAMGSSFADAPWGYNFPVALDPLTREGELGFRGMRMTAQSLPVADDRVEVFNAADRPVRRVSDAVFEGMTYQYGYEAGQLDLDEVTTLREIEQPQWTIRQISIPTGYDDDPMPVTVFLPRRIQAPLQSVIFLPPSDSWAPGLVTEQIELADYQLDFIPRSGRALIWPVYTGSHERYDGALAATGSQRIQMMVERNRRVRDEIGRVLDYLAAEPMFDGSSVALMGLSYGAMMAAYPLATESRLRAAVLYSAGIAGANPLFADPQLDPNPFWARVRQPTLIINGRFDPIRPHHFVMQPLLDLLATPAGDKRGVLLDSAHWPLPKQQMMRETLNWLDRYLGDVNGADSR